MNGGVEDPTGAATTPTGVVLLVQLRDRLDGGGWNRWRRDILIAFDPAEFYADGPFRPAQDAREGPARIEDGSVRINVNTLRAYYDEGHERGDGEHFVRLAEWLERTIPPVKSGTGTT